MTHDEKVDVLADDIVGALKEANADSHYNGRRYPEIHLQLISTKDYEYLKTIHALVLRMAAGGTKGCELLTMMMNYVAFGDRQTMSLIIAHYDDFIIEPKLLVSVTTLSRGLLNKGIMTIGADGRVATLYAHFKAKGHYDQQFYETYGLEDMPEQIEIYRANTVYAAAVERHADQIDKLLAYRDLRGITVDHNERDGYDEEDFLQYLAHGAVGTGWL